MSVGIESVHVVQRMAPGGIETLVLDLVRTGGKRHHVISLDGTTDDLIENWPVLSTIRQQVTGLGHTGGLSPALGLRLVRCLRRLKPHAVVLHHIGPLLYGATAARLAGIARIVHVEHDVWHYADPQRRKIVRWIESLHKPHHVTVSEGSARTLRDLIPNASITVIPNGIEIDRFTPANKQAARAKYGLPLNGCLIGTVGRLVPVKGHADLVASMLHLPDDVRLVIAGDGPERSLLEQRGTDAGIAHRLHFLGHVDGVEHLLPAFDIFCLPSHSEGFPRSVIEAQACDIPVIATDVGSLSEAVCSATGRLVPTRDPIAFAKAVQDLLAARISRAHPPSPRSFVEHRYSWTKTAAAYARVMELSHAA